MRVYRTGSLATLNSPSIFCTIPQLSNNPKLVLVFRVLAVKKGAKLTPELTALQVSA
jgi:hypothetical protein